MSDDETLIQTVDRLKIAVDQLVILMHGSRELRVSGIMEDVKRLTESVQRLERTMRRRRGNPSQWFVGYVMASGGILLLSTTVCNILNIPNDLGAALGAVLWLGAVWFLVSDMGMLHGDQ